MNLQNKTVHPFTLIYLFHDEKVLLLLRSAKKKLLGGKLVGLGGNVEANENILDSAKREFYEETGLNLLNPSFRGTYVWVDETNFAGISHIITATEFSGNLITEGIEGKLSWYDINSLDQLTNFAEYQRNFIPKLLHDQKYFYSGIAFFKGELLSYTDSTRHFIERKK